MYVLKLRFLGPTVASAATVNDYLLFVHSNRLYSFYAPRTLTPKNEILLKKKITSEYKILRQKNFENNMFAVPNWEAFRKTVSAC